MTKRSEKRFKDCKLASCLWLYKSDNNSDMRLCLNNAGKGLNVVPTSTSKNTIVNRAVKSTITRSEMSFWCRDRGQSLKSSTNMADTEFLPVDALARQQLNTRAPTTHRNFIVDNLVFVLSSNRPNVNYDEPNLPSLSARRYWSNVPPLKPT